MEFLAGTSGYAFKEWEGRFYPDDLPKTEQLGHFAGRLPTVEEWTRAARGDTDNLFPWGSRFDVELCVTAEARSNRTAARERGSAGSCATRWVRAWEHGPWCRPTSSVSDRST